MLYNELMGDHEDHPVGEIQISKAAALSFVRTGEKHRHRAAITLCFFEEKWDALETTEQLSFMSYCMPACSKTCFQLRFLGSFARVLRTAIEEPTQR